MRRVLMYAILFGMGLTGFPALSNEEIKPLFINDKKAVSDFLFYRAYVNKKTKIVKLIPAGVLLSKNVQGPGIYSVTFAVDESNKKFQYHQQLFIFYFTPSVTNAKELKQKMNKGAEYLYLVWHKSGKVEFYKHTKDGKNEKIGIWIKPGPKKENAYRKDTFVTMNVIVPKAAENLKIYFNKPAKGEPDCEFIIPDISPKGQFGFYNPKWFSTIKVKDTHYKPFK